MPRMPALFVGHGSPLNAILDNIFTRSLQNLSSRLPRPEAVCLVSAHWQTTGTRVSCQDRLRQIHGFRGFPQEVYEIEYAPPGHPALARRAVEVLGGDSEDIVCDDSWGHDHAGWTVLMHLFPQADMPTFFVSVDMAAPPARHAQLGARLAPLRDEGVLILGSGNLVHNLAAADLGDMDAEPDSRGVRFDAHVRDALLAGDLDSLVGYTRWGQDAAYSVPTLDHYLPLLWVAALREAGEPVTFPCEVIQNRSVSMRSVLVGALG